VQGRLRGEKLRVRIDSECHHCSCPLTLEVDEDLGWEVTQREATPLLFEPDTDWEEFRGANIIHDY
jgi:hypothetical protein